MGKSTGFMEYERQTSKEVPPLERIKNFNEFHEPLSMEEQRKQAARCMDCGVPFCQYGKMIAGMASGTAIQEDGTLVTNGGRVLGVTATADRLTAAITQAYAAAEKISFEKLHKRTDIGFRALKAIAEKE